MNSHQAILKTLYCSFKTLKNYFALKIYPVFKTNIQCQCGRFCEIHEAQLLRKLRLEMYQMQTHTNLSATQ